MKIKVAFVVQRYGIEVVGGAESLCRWIAELMNDTWDIDVLTTCAIDYTSWANSYTKGKDFVNGIKVFRFPVCESRSVNKFNMLSRKIFGRTHSYDDEIEWMNAQGPNSPALIEYINKNKNHYDVFIFFTYLYATTFWGLPLVCEKAFLVPTAHDEPPLHLDIFKDIMEKPKGIIFSTPEEKELIYETFNITCELTDIIGVGVSSNTTASEQVTFRQKLPDKFVLYVGRIDESKGCKTLFNYWDNYTNRYRNDMKLVLVGSNQMELPERDNIIYLGFVNDADKNAIVAKTTCLVMPSPYESLSIVLLEAWMHKLPVLVNGHCKVLKGQCRRSNGGLWYDNYDEFEVCLDLLVGNKPVARALGENGYKYTNENYNWNIIKQKYISLIDAFMQNGDE